MMASALLHGRFGVGGQLPTVPIWAVASLSRWAVRLWPWRDKAAGLTRQQAPPPQFGGGGGSATAGKTATMPFRPAGLSSSGLNRTESSDTLLLVGDRAARPAREGVQLNRGGGGRHAPGP